jgi:hypothetical protein
MTPTIRVDDEVWAWLKGQAEPLVDTPNTVLRRIAGLDKGRGTPRTAPLVDPDRGSGRGGSRLRIYGRDIDKERGVGSAHALYHGIGKWYEHLVRFPGTYHDADGYITFKSKADYDSCPYLNFGVTVNVNHPDGISGIPGYVRV